MAETVYPGSKGPSSSLTSTSYWLHSLKLPFHIPGVCFPSSIKQDRDMPSG